LAETGPGEPPREGSQPGLFGDPGGEGAGDAPPVEERRGPGRPPGARNRRTLDMVAFLETRYASPMEVLAKLANTDTDELARELGCKRLEALQERRHAAVALMPYWHQKMPMEVDVTGKVINIQFGDLGGGSGPENGPILDIQAEVVGLEETLEKSEG
jgi:hypothetical protein